MNRRYSEARDGTGWILLGFGVEILKRTRSVLPGTSPEVFWGTSPKMLSVHQELCSLLELHLPKLKTVQIGSLAQVTMMQNGKMIQNTSAKSCKVMKAAEGRVAQAKNMGDQRALSEASGFELLGTWHPVARSYCTFIPGSCFPRCILRLLP